MKALCIIGSPRDNGSTVLIVDQIIEGMRSVGIEAKRQLLGSLHIGFCRGCRSERPFRGCRVTGECIQHDDMGVLIGQLMQADIVLLASPSYWGEVTAQLKTFIDRCVPLCNARTGETQVPPGKIGISVAIRAGSDPAENLHLVNTIEHYFGHLGITPVGRLTVENISEPTDFEPETLQKAYDLGAHMIGDVYVG